MNLRKFCITLPECPDRTEAARKHFIERDMFDVEFFDGIHAEKFGLQTEHTYELDNPGTNFRMGYKCTGIWLSHYMLWAACNLLWDDMFLIFEDDVMVPEGWKQRVDKALQDVPDDWDGLYVGSCNAKGRGWETRHVKGDIYRINATCTHAIIWRKRAMPVLMATQRKCYAPIDISIVLHAAPKLKIYCVVPRIFHQFNTIIAE